MAMEELEYVCEHILGLTLAHVTKPFTVCCEETGEQANSVYRKVTEDLKYADET